MASSWKNQQSVLLLTQFLRDKGHEVDCFCDTSLGRFVFHWSEFFGPVTEEEAEKRKYEWNAQTFLLQEKTQRAFAEDKKWLDWSEGVVLVLPAGRSAHLEAGYAVGQGKPVWAYGEFPAGEFDVMYGFFKELILTSQLSRLVNSIARRDSRK